MFEKMKEVMYTIAFYALVFLGLVYLIIQTRKHFQKKNNNLNQAKLLESLGFTRTEKKVASPRIEKYLQDPMSKSGKKILFLEQAFSGAVQGRPIEYFSGQLSRLFDPLYAPQTPLVNWMWALKDFIAPLYPPNRFDHDVKNNQSFVVLIISLQEAINVWLVLYNRRVPFYRLQHPAHEEPINDTSLSSQLLRYQEGQLNTDHLMQVMSPAFNKFPMISISVHQNELVVLWIGSPKLGQFHEFFDYFSKIVLPAKA